MAAYLVNSNMGSSSTVVAVGRRVLYGEVCAGIEPQIAADCLEVAFALAEEDDALDCQNIALESVYLELLPLENLRLNNLSVEGSLINEVMIDEVGMQSNVIVRHCDIGKVSGAASQDALPTNIFQSCNVELFDNLSTNAAIVRSALNPKIKAMLTILRKLYVQAGAGRQLSAFKRGIPPGVIMNAIDAVLEELRSEGLIAVEHGIAHPVRKHAGRVRSIIAAANLSRDAIVQRFLSN